MSIAPPFSNKPGLLRSTLAAVLRSVCGGTNETRLAVFRAATKGNVEASGCGSDFMGHGDDSRAFFHFALRKCMRQGKEEVGKVEESAGQPLPEDVAEMIAGKVADAMTLDLGELVLQWDVIRWPKYAAAKDAEEAAEKMACYGLVQPEFVHKEWKETFG
uniref:Uncharacterized protein n=2 Tax=Hemiselmis andersenii TaxID=464988 RepID=A0A6T8NSP6_HEMAN